MRKLFNPQNGKLSGFFRWFQLFVFSNKRCGEGSCGSGGNRIKKIKHILWPTHPFKPGVFPFLVRPFPRKICVHGIQVLMYPGKRGQGSYFFLLWHGFRSNGKFNFRFAGRQFRRNFKGNPAAGRYFNRLLDGHKASVA